MRDQAAREQTKTLRVNEKRSCIRKPRQLGSEAFAFLEKLRPGGHGS